MMLRVKHNNPLLSPVLPMHDTWGKLRKCSGMPGRRLAGRDVGCKANKHHEQIWTNDIHGNWKQVHSTQTIVCTVLSRLVTWTQLWRAAVAHSYKFSNVQKYMFLNTNIHEQSRTYFSQITNIAPCSKSDCVRSISMQWSNRLRKIYLNKCFQPWIHDETMAENLHVKIFQESASTFQVFLIKISKWAKRLPLLHIGTLLQSLCPTRSPNVDLQAPNKHGQSNFTSNYSPKNQLVGFQ